MGTAISSFPSWLKSPIARVEAEPGRAMLVSVNVPPPFPRNTLTLLLSVLTTIKSVVPIPRRSAAATQTGVCPRVTGKMIGRLNVPSPFPE